jgi:hypothetical protein
MAVVLTITSRCLQDGCEWSATGPKASSQADGHTKKERHATVTSAVPLLRVAGDPDAA